MDDIREVANDIVRAMSVTDCNRVFTLLEQIQSLFQGGHIEGSFDYVMSLEPE